MRSSWRSCAANGLRPSPEADRRTLLRRVYLRPDRPAADAGGGRRRSSPTRRPTPTRSSSTGCSPRPRYGERWARHWLDVVHFAETHGHDQDRPRPNAWPYRDYLIRVVQRRQAVRPVRPRSRSPATCSIPTTRRRSSATGFLAAGPWDESVAARHPRRHASTSADRPLPRPRRHGRRPSCPRSPALTVHCARCHDHKFDPISQDGLLRACRRSSPASTRPTGPTTPTRRSRRKRRALTADAGPRPQLERQADAEPARPPIARRRSRRSGASRAPTDGRWIVLDAGGVRRRKHGATLEALPDRSVLSAGTRPGQGHLHRHGSTPTPKASPALRLEVLRRRHAAAPGARAGRTTATCT